MMPPATAASSAYLPAVRTLLYGPARIGLLAFLLLAVSSVAGVVLLNLNHAERLGQIHDAVEHLHQVQAVGLELTRLQVAAAEGTPMQAADLAHLHASLEPFLDPSRDLATASAALFRAASSELLENDKPLALRVALAQRDLRDATFSEVGAGSGQLEASVADARRQTLLALIVFLVLPVVGLAAFLGMQRRVASSLHSLQGLLTGLAGGQLNVVAVDTPDSTLRALFETYNRAVNRLAELEQQHLDRASSLQREVRQVTHQVMVQQAALARSERLAAVGELSAGIAHELRNPLAGIQLAVSNIGEVLTDPDLQQRAAMVVSECQRMARLLTELLASARRPPEPFDTVDIRQLFEQFAVLARFQAPPGVGLDVQAPVSQWLELPAEGLRQALLNLVLNAFEAMRASPGEVMLWAELRDETLVVGVHDQGTGFAPAMLSQGPQAFRSAREGGTGLGLAVVQRFVDSHGGRLILGNDMHGSAMVTLHLPVRRRPGAVPPAGGAVTGLVAPGWADAERGQ